jgi:hypothetical protein
VVPLYELSLGVVNRRPTNWNEDVMRGQLFRGLQIRELMMDPEKAKFLKLDTSKSPPLWEYDGTDSPWHNWCVPFFKWLHEEKPRGDMAQVGMQHYASIYGVWCWKDHWDFWTTVVSAF